MNNEFYISSMEKNYLRELAQKYLEYANLPIMEKRKKMWYDHNSLKGQVPMIVMEMGTFEGDILPSLKCESYHGKFIEKKLLKGIINHELINDDKVISPFFTLNWKITINEFGLDIQKKFAKDSSGKELGYAEDHPIKDLQRDFHILKPSTFNVDRDYTLNLKSNIEEIFGDIMPVKIKNNSLEWHMAPSAKAVKLMSMETMFFSMIDYPEEFHQLFNFIKDDILSFVKWQEKEGLLTLNNGNDYAGAGSYGFTHELPTEQFINTGIVTSKDIWGNLNSQETVGVSEQMFGEFIFPYYNEIAKNFGATYYGCCEPVHPIWDNYISKLANLRKVSISPWCDEEYMGNALRGSNVIYSRKPSPNFVGVGSIFDEDGFADHITKTLEAAKGCSLEIICRDIYNLSGDISKPGKAVNIIRKAIESKW